MVDPVSLLVDIAHVDHTVYVSPASKVKYAPAVPMNALLPEMLSVMPAFWRIV